MPVATLPDEYRADIATLWDFNQMHHELHPVDLGIGLGSHDLGVATYAAELYHRGMFPRIAFTGANAPTTVERFPRGEAVHYREHALTLDVPDDAILVEPRATHTGENIDFTRELTDAAGLTVGSIMLISRPYQQRRAYAMCRLRWPEVEVICASQRTPLDDYVAGIGDPDRVINMLVGDTQRVWVYAENGWSIDQDVPASVRTAYDHLVAAGFTQRVISAIS
ncbi:YdcF family protein [Pseudonocardia sp. GCM10023141]|uniref:YdcF family protein n=1 Tax=Pseudonocardia sp. GCM10023141 TaxID=3252653 RepID=UPI0036181525